MAANNIAAHNGKIKRRKRGMVIATPTPARSRGAWCSRQQQRGSTKCSRYSAPPALRADAREAEAAERLPADQGPGDAAVEIEVAHAELAPGRSRCDGLRLNTPPVSLYDGRVGHVQGLVEAAHAHHRQHRAEDLLVGQAMVRLGCRRRCAGRRRACRRVSASPAGTSQASSSRPSLLADLDVLADLRGGRLVDHRADVGARVGRIADHQRAGRFDQPLEELVVDAVEHDRPAARRAFLAAVAEGRLPHAEHGLVQVGRLVDDDGVLAAHLADDLLDERLALGRFAGGAEDAEADLLRAGEGDQGHARVADQDVADRRGPRRAGTGARRAARRPARGSRTSPGRCRGSASTA